MTCVHIFQPGNRRVASETQQVVEDRLDMAIKPKMIQKIKNHARDTGVKDSMAQLVIDNLLELGKRLRNPPAGVPRRSPREVEATLQNELKLARANNCINPLLSMPGKFALTLNIFYSTYRSQVWTFIVTLPQKSFIRFYLV